MLQLEETECGAASLGIVLGYYGRRVPLEELRVACGVSRDGTNLEKVTAAGAHYGLEVEVLRLEIGDLRALPMPVIVHWQFNHVLVVEGFGRDRVFVNDPATGPRTVDLDEFDRSFTGIVIALRPGPDFTRGGRWPSAARGLLRRLGRARAGLVYCIVAGLALVAPGLGVALLLRMFIDEYLVGGRKQVLGLILVGFVAAALLQLLLTAVQQRVLLRVQTKLALRMSTETIASLLRLPMSFFTQRSAGDLAWRASLNDQLAQLLSGQLSQAVLGLLTALLYIGLMLYFDLWLTGVLLVITSLYVVTLLVGARRRRDLNARQLREEADVTSTAAGGINLIESVKAGGGESALFDRWSSKFASLVQVRQRLDLSVVPLSVLPPMLGSMAVAAVLGIGALFVLRGDITIGTLVLFQVLMAGFLTPLTAVVSLGSSYQQVAGMLHRLDDVIMAAPDPEVAEPSDARTGNADSAVAEPPSPNGGRPAAPHRAVGPGFASDRSPPRLEGELEVRSVTFGYSPADPALITDLSLHLLPGQRVALVGPTGSGKSTVSRLVTGLYQPWTGEVLLDRRPRAAFHRHAITSSIAFVDQQIMLFEGSVRDNLTLWDPTVPHAELIRAASDAQILNTILSRPGGLDAHVEEGGRNFSGGQRQQLEIARALVRRPSLLVLDEATSALDPPTEYSIDLALRRRGCTCLIVAHRLSTIRDADHIVVLASGQVVEQGTHEELLAYGGRYAALVVA